MFSGAYTGKILRINLGTRSYRVEEVPADMYRKYLGGRGVAAAYYYKEIGPEVDPVSPENKLIFFTGPLTGLPLPATGKFQCSTKSPETGHYLCSNSGGKVGPFLKFCGFDGLIVEGRASEPLYLWINNGKVEFRDASPIWTAKVSDAVRWIKEDTSQPKVGVMAIGPASIRGANIACIMVDGRSFGRGGAGRVMASKNLKAIAVYGSQPIPVAHREAVKELGRRAIKDAQASRVTLTKYGTNHLTDSLNKLGCYPTRNFKTAVFQGIDTISAEYMVRHYKVRNAACYRCPVACGQVCQVKEGPFVGSVADPEYETIGALGALCGVSDLSAVIAANQLCDEYGLDTISTGNMIAYAMECFEKGLFTVDDTQGLELRFGDGVVMVNMVRQIGEGEGLGADLGKGFRYLAKKYPQTVSYMMHTKWLPFAAYEPRGFYGMGLTFGTSSRGACHNVGGWTVRDELLSGEYDRFAVKGKGRLVKQLQDTRAFIDSLGICTQVRSSLGFGDNPKGKVLELATGYNFIPELKVIGERIYCLERVILVREGISRKDDMLPPRIMQEALPEGPASGSVLSREMYEMMLDEYYEAREWDHEGRPTQACIDRLDVIP
ncbi:MAG: aldehyde ferredoxin oxidoreductase family protein [Thermoanaerobacteraceae bacterium]|nr:aldehyde ferredoxin oxidoreductase family protein [Thermoanaerobacteraceae bacterium]